MLLHWVGNQRAGIFSFDAYGIYSFMRNGWPSTKWLHKTYSVKQNAEPKKITRDVYDFSIQKDISRSVVFCVQNYASWYLKFSVESQELCKLRLRGLIWYALEFNGNCPAACVFFFSSFFNRSLPLILRWLCFDSLQYPLALWCEREHSLASMHCIWAATLVCMHRVKCRKKKHVVCMQCAQTCRFQKLKSQTVWRIWWIVCYVSFGLLFFSTSLTLSVVVVVADVDDGFVFFLLYHRFSTSNVHLMPLIHMCGYLNAQPKHCTLHIYTKQKFLVKIYLWPLAFIFLEFVVYLSLFIIHIWSFHFIFFASLHSLRSFVRSFGFSFVLSSSLHLFHCAVARVLSLCTHKKKKYLKWNFLPFEEFFSSKAECITRFYDVWSIQNHNIFSPIHPSIRPFIRSSVHLSLSVAPFFSMELP